MRIGSSSVLMAGNHQQEQDSVRQEQYHCWDQDVDIQANQQVNRQEAQRGVFLTLSAAARQLLREGRSEQGYEDKISKQVSQKQVAQNVGRSGMA